VFGFSFNFLNAVKKKGGGKELVRGWEEATSRDYPVSFLARLF
jgi:hypothetical protein